MWDRNGHVFVRVTQRHINEAMEKNSSHCMTAEAIKEAIPDAKFVSVDLQTIRFTRKGKDGQALRYCFLTPRHCQRAICCFDQGERDAIKPFELRMRPAYVTRSGTKRTQTPSNTQLRGSGLTVAKRQPHIDGDQQSKPQPNRSDPFQEAWTTTTNPPTQRYNADGSRNLDPDRSDGLAPPPKRGTSQAARAKVSAAFKGTVPTTLGGKLPPVSVLQRREFGLRVLRK